jgi:uncharacterized protein YeaO (DUF488 family)
MSVAREFVWYKDVLGVQEVRRNMRTMSEQGITFSSAMENELAQDRDRWQTLVNAVMILRAP